MLRSINRINVAQLVLIVFLGFSLIAPIATANAAATIALEGQIDPATIDIAMDKASLNLDIPVGDTTKSDTVTITSTALIPVVMTLQSVAHQELEPGVNSWSPTLITGDPTALGLTDAQNQARFTLNLDTGDADYSVAPSFTKVAPTGDGSAVSTFDGAYSVSVYPVILGTIADSPDGVVQKQVVLTGTLDASKKRILSKAFKADMVLNFAAPE